MWTEQYRPSRLNDVVGHEKLKRIIQKCIEVGDFPNFFFYGKPGTGKTSIAEIIGREFLGECFDSNFIEINASDDRTVQKMRDIVLNAVKHSTVNGYMRIILLDEMDGILEPAQELLRRPMEKSQKTRFILTANNEKSVIEPIKDRCMCFEFKSLKKDDIVKRLIFIRDNEKANIELPEIERIAKESGGSMRKAITELEKASMSDNEEEAILRRYLKK